MNHQAQTRPTLTAGSVALVATFVLLLSAGPARATGSCTSADIDEPFRLPDGSLHDAGRLSLCLDRHHSPVAALHEARVDGRALGLFASRSDQSEGLLEHDATPFMMFNRLKSGELALVGLGTPGRDRMQLYWLGYRALSHARRHPPLYALAEDPALLIVRATTL